MISAAACRKSLIRPWRKGGNKALPAEENKKARYENRAFRMVPKAGLEPARLTPLPPQDSVSTNSTTSAETLLIRSTALPCRSRCRRQLLPLQPPIPQRFLRPPAFRMRKYLQPPRFFQHLFARRLHFFLLRPMLPAGAPGYPMQALPLALREHPADQSLAVAFPQPALPGQHAPSGRALLSCSWHTRQAPVQAQTSRQRALR